MLLYIKKLYLAGNENFWKNGVLFLCKWSTSLLFFAVLCFSRLNAQTPSGGQQSKVSATINNRTSIVTSNSSGGPWSSPSTWVGGSVPAVGDDVFIANAATVTININTASLGSLTVGQGTSGILQYDAAAVRTVTVTGDVTIATGGTFKSAPSGSTSTIKTHSLICGGSLTNNGILNFSARAGLNGSAANASGALITFTGLADANFNCSGAALTNLRQSTGVTLKKGSTSTSILSFIPGGTLQVESANSSGFLTILNGTFKISGTNSFDNPVFGIPGYSIPKTGGFWLNNPNASIVAQNNSVTNSGLLRITSGTYNVGTASGNSLQTPGGATGFLQVEGGNVSVAGRLVNSTGTAMITGGTINLATKGNGSATDATFDMGLSTDLTISGNPLIIIEKPNSSAAGGNDINIINSTGTKSITGGTFQIGNATTAANSSFLINSQVPLYNLSIFNNTAKLGLKNSDLTLNNQLTLNGQLLLNNQNLILAATAPAIDGTLGSANGMIVTNGSGEVRKTLAAYNSYLFPIGTNPGTPEYTPVTLTYAGLAGVSVSNTKHPSNKNSTDFLKRHWSVNSSGITSSAFNFTGGYLTTDVVGNEANIAIGKYTGSALTRYGKVNSGAKTFSATGVTDAAPVISFAGIALADDCGITLTSTAGSNAQTICEDLAIRPITYSIGAGATEVSVAGLPPGVTGTYSDGIFTINGKPTTASGAYTYTVTATGSTCTNVTATGTITVNTPPTVTTNPNENTICANNQAAIFNAAATSYVNPSSITWQVSADNGTTWSTATGTINNSYSSGTANTSLQFTPGNPDNGNLYRAVFINACGTTSTAAAILNVGGGVNFPKDLEGQAGCTAGSATLTTKITGGVGLTGTLTFSWERSLDGINWTLIPGTTDTHPSSGSYNPSYTPKADETNYYFRLAVSNNGCVTYSNAARVTVVPKAVVDQPNNVQGCNNTPVTVNFTGTNVTTYNWTNNNTAIGLVASGTGNISFTATNTTAGPLTATITVTPFNASSGLNCAGDAKTFTITVNPTPAATINGTNISCNGAANGTATVTPTVGTSPFTYLWSNNATTQTINNLTPGTYTATVTDAKGCTSAPVTYTVSQPTAISAAPSTTSTNVSCNGGNNGTINLSVNATGGTGTLTSSFAWTGPNGFTSAAQNPTGLAAGTYNVIITVTDANGCSKTFNASRTLTEPTAITASATAPAILCNGGTTTITVTATGGTAPLQYSTNGTTLQTGNTFANQGAGSYTITVKDANGCTTTTLITIAPAPAAITASASAPAILCNGGTTTITVNASGGTGALQYSTNGTTFQAGNTFPNVGAGSYTITVKDANGCTITTPLTIAAAPAAITASAAAPAIVCNGSTTTITVTASGGTAPLQYSIGGTTFQAGNTFPNVGAGSYTITVKDANGCTTTTPLTIAAPPPAITASAAAPAILCNGGTTTITVTASGGTPFGGGKYDFSINGTTFTNSASPFAFTNVGAGSYTITVKDASGCTTTTPLTIAPAPPAITSAAAAPAILCNGATTTITVTASGGTAPLQYSTNGTTFQAGNTFPNVGAGSYTITVKDANGCTTTTPLTIAAAPAAITASAAAPAIACNGGTTTITVTASGGTAPLQYLLDGTTFQNGNTFANQTAGTYTITVKDANGCTKTAAVTIANAPSAITATANAPAILCNGATTTITVTASGGTGTLQYSINGTTFQASNTFASQGAGSYTITVKDANGCTTTTPITIAPAPSAITASAAAPAILCNGATTTITVTASGGTAPLQYSTNGTTFQAGNTFPNVGAGNYTITVKDANGCTTTTPLTIAAAPAAITASAAAPAIACNGATTTITVTASGGTAPLQYSLDGTTFQNGNTFANQTAGTYTITVKDANGCTKTAAVTIANPPSAITATANASAITCNGGTTTITATASGGTPFSGSKYDFSINGSTFTSSASPFAFTNVGAGSYTIIVRDASGCTTTTPLTIAPAPSAITVSASAPAILCNGGTTTITVTASGGTGALLYSTNGTAFQSGNTFLNVAAGSYTITVKDANGCTTTTPLTIAAAPPAIAASAAAPPIACNGGTTTITVTASGGTAPLQYSSDGTTFQPGNTFPNVGAGSYTITVKDANGCIRTATLTIATAPLSLTASAAAPAILCSGGTTTITVTASGGTAPFQYSTNGTTFQTGNTFASQGAGSYTITVRDANGCTTTTPLTIAPAPAAITASASAPAILCNGGTTTITVNASGGTGALQYSTNGTTFQAGNTFLNVGAGSYTITVKDANGCTITTPLTIAAPPPAITASAAAPAIVCNGSTTTITVTASGGTGPLQYSIGGTTFQAGSTFPNVGAGSYTITVKDAKGCTTTTPLTIAAPPPAITASAAAPAILCNGGTTTITATASGGTPTSNGSKYDFSINGTTFASSGSPYTFKNVGAGSYTVTVKDVNGCIGTASVTIAAAPPAITASASAPAITCNGGTTTITVTASGGTGALQYSINGTAFQSGNTFSNVSAGSYTITVKDASGCTTTRPVTVAQPPVLTISTQPVSQTDCNGNKVVFTATISGGTTAYSYQWQRKDPGGVFTNIPATDASVTGASGSTSSTTISLSILSIGTNSINIDQSEYRVVIIDANGCTVTSTPAVLTVNKIEAISPGSTTTTTTVICEGGTFTFTVTTSGSTPVSYQWLKDGTSLTNGTVNGVTISGANTATLTVTNASPSESGSYKVDVRFNVVDGSGVPKTCNERSTVTRDVTVNPKATVTPGGPNTVCQSATPSAITLTGASVGGGATTGAWSITSGGGTLSSTAQTTNPETVTYTPAADFTGTVTLTLTTNAPGTCPAVSATRTINVTALPVCSINPAAGNGSCPGATNAYTASANMDSYAWTVTGNATITSGQGTATVTVKVGAVCGPYTVSLVVTKNNCSSNCSQPYSAVDTEKPTVTGTGSITIPGCNPANPSSSFVPPTGNDNCGTPTLKSGYPVDGSVTSGGNCTKSQTRTWIYVDACGNESAPFVQTITWAICQPTITGTLNVCVGLTTQLTGSGTPAVSNAWVSSLPGVATVTSSGLVTGVSTGTSTITYTDSNGCSQTVTITVNPKPTPKITHN